MVHSAYEACKGLAYPTLSALASCDHSTAQVHGYKDGWQMLLDKHDGDEMVVFCMALPHSLSPKQCNVLLDALAKEYTEFDNWGDFATACAEHPNWKPSRERLAQYTARKVA